MYKQIIDYLACDIYPFHMPGHKRNPKFFPPNLQCLDMTEIPGMDVLSSPTGIIKQLQAKISSIYDAEHSFFLVNGSSSGIVAAVCATCADGATIIVPRNAHTSVYNGIAICGANPQYIMPETTPDGLAGGINPKIFDNMPEGAVVLVVSPTYEGFVSDIASIADKVHSKKGILVVDEAHGAHFPFHKIFPASALELGADIVVQSLHKTLPAPSQCAVLHVKSNAVDINRIKFHINAVQTSSPSYILMSVCDFMLQLLWPNSNYFNDYIEILSETRNRLAELAYLSGRERIGSNGIYDIDIGKLLFTLPDNNAEHIAKIMANEYKVQMEMATGRHILAMTSVADTADGFERLVKASEAIFGQRGIVNATDIPDSFSVYRDRRTQTSENLMSEAGYMELPKLPEIVMSPRKAVVALSKEVLWEEAVGQVSAQLIAKYPPGIALVAPGERIPHDIPKQSETIRVVK